MRLHQIDWPTGASTKSFLRPKGFARDEFSHLDTNHRPRKKQAGTNWRGTHFCPTRRFQVGPRRPIRNKPPHSLNSNGLRPPTPGNGLPRAPRVRSWRRWQYGGSAGTLCVKKKSPSGRRIRLGISGPVWLIRRPLPASALGSGAPCGTRVLKSPSRENFGDREEEVFSPLLRSIDTAG